MTDHQNWFGTDDTLGPVAISIRREKVDNLINQVDGCSNSSANSNPQLSRYRLIVRTSEVRWIFVLRFLYTLNTMNKLLNVNDYFLLRFPFQLQTLRGSVLEDAIPNLKPSHSGKNINTKEVLEYVFPEVQLSWWEYIVEMYLLMCENTNFCLWILSKKN